MTDTEALEVKEMAVTEEASEDTRVQATVGDNEVAALVDEAQYEVKNVEDEASQEKKMEVEVLISRAPTSSTSHSQTHSPPTLSPLHPLLCPPTPPPQIVGRM